MSQFLVNNWPVIYCVIGFIYWLDCVFIRKLEAREYPLMGWVWFLGWPLFILMHIGIWITKKIVNEEEDILKNDEYLIPGKSYERLFREYQRYGSLWIYVDYDNTIYDFHKKGYTYQNLIEVLILAKAIGNKIVIFTANPDHGEVYRHCESIGLEIEGINIDGHKLGWESRKPFYNLLLDDRAGLESAYKDLKKLVNHVFQHQIG